MDLIPDLTCGGIYAYYPLALSHSLSNVSERRGFVTEHDALLSDEQLGDGPCDFGDDIALGVTG